MIIRSYLLEVVRNGVLVLKLVVLLEPEREPVLLDPHMPPKNHVIEQLVLVVAAVVVVVVESHVTNPYVGLGVLVLPPVEPRESELGLVLPDPHVSQKNHVIEQLVPHVIHLVALGVLVLPPVETRESELGLVLLDPHVVCRKHATEV
jgi:hypothetical protein